MRENLTKGDIEREQKRQEEEAQRVARKERIRIIMERTRKTDMEKEFPSRNCVDHFT